MWECCDTSTVTNSLKIVLKRQRFRKIKGRIVQFFFPFFLLIPTGSLCHKFLLRTETHTWETDRRTETQKERNRESLGNRDWESLNTCFFRSSTKKKCIPAKKKATMTEHQNDLLEGCRTGVTVNLLGGFISKDLVVSVKQDMTLT
jgi:hypothetical protein